MIMIDERDALNGLRQAVSAKGAGYTYPYQRCVYAAQTDDGLYEPRCMVGYALGCLGVPLRVMYALGNQISIRRMAEKLREVGVCDFTERAVQILSAAQAAQDRAPMPACPCGFCAMRTERSTWGTALRLAQQYTTPLITRAAPFTTIPAVVTTAAVSEADIKHAVEELMQFTQQSALTSV